MPTQYFLSSNENSRGSEQEIEPYTVFSLTLSTSEIQDLSCSSSLRSDQTLTDWFLHNSTLSVILSSSLKDNSHRKFIPNDISMSCNDTPAQKELTMYLTNQQNRSFQSG